MTTVSLPDDLKRYISERGLFEGFTGSDRPGYVALWSIADVPAHNASIEIDVYAPGFLAFAGNGGGEVLVFDATGVVCMLPLIGMDPEYAIKIAESFSALAETFELDF